MSIVKGKPKATIFSTCSYHYANMNYNAACDFTNSSPCTNVPTQCTMCSPSRSGQHPTIWKYNSYHHLVARHVNPETPAVHPDIPLEITRKVRLESREEKALGIGKDIYKRHRSKFKIPNASSDAPEPEPADHTTLATPGTATPRRKKDRAISDLSQLSKASRNPSPTKRTRQIQEDAVDEG